MSNLVNKEVLMNVFANLKLIFLNAFAAAPSQWEKIAMKVPSTGRQNDYSWLSDFPMMREWVGDKVYKTLEAFKYTIINKDYETTITVERNDIEDDQLGIYGPKTQMAGEAAKKLPDQIVFSLVNDGFGNKCFDGQNFFDMDHRKTLKDGTVVSVANMFDKPLSISSLDAAKASFGAASIAMMEFTNDEDETLDIMPTILLVPPALKDVANTLATAEKLGDETNIYRGTFEVVVATRLKSRTAWYLLDTSKPVKPFIWQERKPPTFVQQTSMESADVFDRAIYKYGAEARGAGGYGFWQTAFGSTGTGAAP